MRFWGSSKLDEIGWCWMHIQAWIWWQGILLQSQFSLCLCILKSEAYAQKLDRSKTPAQLHIMNWHPDVFVIFRHCLSLLNVLSIFNIQDCRLRGKRRNCLAFHSPLKKYCNKFFDQFWLGLVSVRKVWQLQAHILTRRRAARLLDKTMQFFNAVDLSRPF